MLARLGRWCHNRRVAVVAIWVLALVGLGGVSAALGGPSFSTEFGLPDIESRRGLTILEERFGGAGAGIQGNIVWEVTGRPDGVKDPEVQAAMEQFLAKVAAIPDVTVQSPYTPEGALQVSPLPGVAGTIAFAGIEFPADASLEEAQAVGKQIQGLAPTVPGLQIEYAGDFFVVLEPPSAEILGLAFAIFILIVAFGSVLAMGLPIGTAIFGIGVGVITIGLVSRVVTMPELTTTLAIMIGLGVGIDYALFIVTRYREGMHAGLGSERSATIAINTAGRAVLFAGTTVVISLLGMLAMNIDFVRGLAIGAASVVFFSMIASVTLLPALLGFAQERVEITRWRGIIAAGLVALALIGLGLKIPGVAAVAVPLAVVILIAGFFVGPLKAELPRRPPKPVEQTLPYRWSRVVQHHPWPAAIGGVVLLVVLAIPLFSLNLGFSDAGNNSPETTTRRAYDMLAKGFGPGFNGPLVLVTTIDGPQQAAGLDAVTEALRGAEGVAFATPAVPNDPANPTAALWRVFPTTSPQDNATTDLVHRLREQVLPAATASSGLTVIVAGTVGLLVDFSDYLAARMPLFLGVVLGLSFLLLMAVFRSLLVPLKAVIMNLLSIGAAYGVVVFIFQWGWGASLFGVGKAGPIEPFVPMMMFAIVFGLSMDYEVFLLSRIKEEYDRHGNNNKAVADGLAATARVITAAAAIMVFIFAAFVLEDDRIIKLFGVGLATAVFLDATVVRMLLVPATMELLGDANWWLPKWLGKIIPRIDVEGTGSETIDVIEKAEHDRVSVPL